MIRSLTLLALLSSLPAVLTAQSQSDTSRAGPPSTAVVTSASAAERHLAPICDGAEMRRFERRRRWGGALALGTLAGQALVVGLNSSSPNSHGAPGTIDNRAMTFLFATLPVAAVGYHLYRSSYPGKAFWERTLARARIGETRTADVRSCLHAPSATSSSGVEEKWTYFTTRPDAWLSRGSLGTVSFTFQNGVLTEVRRSEVKLPQPWTSTELLPVVVPVP